MLLRKQFKNIALPGKDHSEHNMSKAILKLSLEFAVYPSANTFGLSPDYKWSGTAFKVISGDSVEDCISTVRQFCRESGFSIIKDGIAHESRTGSSPANGHADISL